MARHGKFRSLADGFHYYFRVCIFCKRLACTHKECQTPKCVNVCSNSVTGYNTNFKFVCSSCYGHYLKEFEAQFPKLHTEDDNAA